MKRNKSFKIIPMLLAAVFFVVAAYYLDLIELSPGGASKAASSGNKSSLSKKELMAVTRAMKVKMVSIRPNSADFMVFSGDITNGSKKTVVKATVAVQIAGRAPKTAKSKKPTKPPGRIVGDTQIENLVPGETGSFTIITSIKAPELTEYSLRLTGLDVGGNQVE